MRWYKGRDRNRVREQEEVGRGRRGKEEVEGDRRVQGGVGKDRRGQEGIER